MQTINLMKKAWTLAIPVLLFIGSCKKDIDVPKPNAIEPGAGAANALVTLTGSEIGKVRTIYFETDSVPAPFNTNFNTENALLFRVPTDAIPGPQRILFRNVDGTEFSVQFTVLGLATVTDVSNYNFVADDELTLTGKNLADVTSVRFSGTEDEIAIVSQTLTTLVIHMPATALNRSRLDLFNAAGISTTTQEFVNVDNAFKIFTDDYAPGYQDASWGSPGFISTTVSKRGTSSVGKVFAAGNWHQLGFGWTNTPDDSYTYLSFWVKGASVDYPLWISTPTSVSGFASFEDNTKINVPANVWTYFKLPVATLKLWNTGTEWNQIGWRIQGPNGQDETFYLDDVILVK